MSSAPIVFFDDTCGFCQRGVRWLIDRAAAGELHDIRLAPLGGETFLALGGATSLAAGGDAVALRAVMSDQRILWLRASDAVLVLLSGARRPWRWLAMLLRLVPRSVRELGYRLVARHRHALAPGACPAPTPDMARRMLP